MQVRVFLVDDLQRMRSLMEDLFSAIGGMQVVGTAATEAEAKLWLLDHSGAWDIAIVDLVLEQGSGLGVLKYSKEKWPQRQVVVFSGYASPGIREYCMRLGADAVFDKVQTEAFISWLYEAVQAARRSAPPSLPQA